MNRYAEEPDASIAHVSDLWEPRLGDRPGLPDQCTRAGEGSKNQSSLTRLIPRRPIAETIERCQTANMEIVFTVTQEPDGGFVGECLSHDIFAEGDDWEALRANASEAVNAYFFDAAKPSRVRLHFVRDEIFAVA